MNIYQIEKRIQKIMNKTFWIFGDSWAWGWGGLNPNPIQFKNRYSILFADYLKVNKIEDKSYYGMSIGKMVDEFLKESIYIKKGDIVFVTIPPDSRGYYAAENDVEAFHSIFHYDTRYEQLLKLNNYNFYYFKFHLSLFINVISDTCKRLGVECIMQHNYGKLYLTPWCNTENFLDIDNSMWDWLLLPKIYDLSLFKETDGPGYLNFEESQIKEFKKKLIYLSDDKIDFHPNEASHDVIFKNLIHNYTKKNNLSLI